MAFLEELEGGRCQRRTRQLLVLEDTDRIDGHTGKRQRDSPASLSGCRRRRRRRRAAPPPRSTPWDHWRFQRQPVLGEGRLTYRRRRWHPGPRRRALLTCVEASGRELGGFHVLLVVVGLIKSFFPREDTSRRRPLPLATSIQESDLPWCCYNARLEERPGVKGGAKDGSYLGRRIGIC